MKCDQCKVESSWLECIGKYFICHKCINKSKLMGLILRTHMDTFRFIVRKLKIKSYDELLAVTRVQVDEVANLSEKGIY